MMQDLNSMLGKPVACQMILLHAGKHASQENITGIKVFAVFEHFDT